MSASGDSSPAELELAGKIRDVLAELEGMDLGTPALVQLESNLRAALDRWVEDGGDLAALVRAGGGWSDPGGAIP